MPTPAARARVRRLALLSILVATGVMALKFVAFNLTGSIALFSDAVETIVNVLAAAVAWAAIGYAQRPADADHPFGHHKAEYLAAVLEGVLVVGAAALIALAAVTDIAALVSGTGDKTITRVGAGLGVNLLAAAINAAWAWHLLRAARSLRSPALEADARHVRADVVTSIGVAAGIVVAIATGRLILDPLIALVVALVVLWQGARLLLASVGGLMDRVVPEDEADAIRATIAASMAGAIEVHAVRMREAGPAIFLDCHLVVPASMTVGAAHRICDRIEAALAAGHPHLRATIHIEPEHEARGGDDPHALGPDDAAPPSGTAPSADA